jgi:AraC-like DNA-binding protein
MVNLGRGILQPQKAERSFSVERRDPSEPLAGVVERYWITTWDLRGEQPHRQNVLPHPRVNMTFIPGRARIAGVVRGLFTEQLADSGRAIGVMFRPGGFRGYLGAPISTITDRFVPVADHFGPPGAELAERVVAADTDDALRAIEAFLLERLPPPDESVDLASRAVDLVATTPDLLRVDDLATALDLTMRGLQRLFNEYVGAAPKWVIRQYRMHEATDAAIRGADVDWAALAHRLGYSDQAHFVRDFTGRVGMSPTAYAKTARQ